MKFSQTKLNQLRKMIAKKMSTPQDKLRSDESIYHGGAQGAQMGNKRLVYGRPKLDSSNEYGHGLFEDQGLTNYLKHHENDEVDRRKHK